MGLTQLSRVVIATDNCGTKCIAENAVYHLHTKHIVIKYRYFWQIAKQNKTELMYVPTSPMPAAYIRKHYTDQCIMSVGKDCK